MRVIKASKIYTMNDAGTIAEAIALNDNGKIHAVGSLSEVMIAAGDDVEILDLGAQVVAPGFIDAHMHLSIAAVYQGTIDCQPSAVGTMHELVTQLRECSATQTPGSWVVGFGYDELGFRERRHPTRHDLDVAFPDRPVYLMHFSCHEGVANSKALELAQIGRSTQDPPGGQIVRDRRGEPTGHLIEAAIGAVERLATADVIARDDQAFLARMKSIEAALFSYGVTRIADLVVPPAMEALYRMIHQEKLLQMPIVMMPVGGNGYLHPPLDRLDGTRTGEGDDTLRVGPMKLFFDGANHCSLCFSIGQVFGTGIEFAKMFIKHRSFSFLKNMRMGTSHLGRDLHIHSGFCYYPTKEEARKVAQSVTAAGFGIASHASGNEAIRMAVHAMAKQKYPAHQPPRIEHALFLEKETARRAADAGIMLVMQPKFITFFGDGSVPHVSKIAMVGLKTALDAGCVVAGSSDSPVTVPDPLVGMRAAVTREVGEKIFLPEEAVAPEQVLEMYTKNAARAIGCSDATGSLEVGKRADLVVLSMDPCAAPIDWEKLFVAKTFLAGELVYSR